MMTKRTGWAIVRCSPQHFQVEEVLVEAHGAVTKRFKDILDRNPTIAGEFVLMKTKVYIDKEF